MLNIEENLEKIEIKQYPSSNTSNKTEKVRRKRK